MQSLFRARCPRCGQGKLYKSWLSVADRCTACGLALKQHEQGDGPAFFAILFVSTLTAVLASVVEIRFAPPFWLHAILWGPFIILTSLLCLRLSKTAIIHVQYRYKRDEFDI